MMAHSQALDALYQKVARGELIVCPPSLSAWEDRLIDTQDNATERYELEVKDRIDAYAGQTSRQKYAKDQRYMDFHSSIWVHFLFFSILSDDECNLQEVHHPDEAMPPITEFVGKGKWYLNITITSPHYALPRRKWR